MSYSSETHEIIQQFLARLANDASLDPQLAADMKLLAQQRELHLPEKATQVLEQARGRINDATPN